MDTCTHCGTSLADAERDTALGIAVCPACGAMSSLDAPARLTRAPEPPLGALAAETTATRFRIAWRWVHPITAAAAVFSVFYTLSCLWMLPSAATTLEGALTVATLLLGGSFFVWRTLPPTLTRTEISVSTAGRVAVQHTPIASWPSPSLAITTPVTQVYVRAEHRDHRTDLERLRLAWPKRGPLYSLRAVGPEGDEYLLVDGMPDLEHALWLEARLEAVLGLDDHEVVDEVSRSHPVRPQQPDRA
jgi:hypothetical protein